MNDPSNTPETVFSPAVHEAMRRHHKIEAIKLLREERKIGLKEAKDIIDAHFADYRNTRDARRRSGESGSGRHLFLLVAFLAVVYGLYRLFA